MRHTFMFLLCLVCLTCFAIAGPFQQPNQDFLRSDHPSLELQTTEGTSFKINFPREKPLVTLFLMTDCPIANASAPEIARTLEQYKSSPVDFIVVYVDADLSLKKIEEHQAKYNLQCLSVLDPYRLWTQRLSIDIAPQVTIHDANGSLLYQGRIDDRYNDYGKRKAEATVHYLFDSIGSVLAGKKPEPRQTKPIGCHVFRDQKISASAKSSFVKDIAPIVHSRCATCHQPGQIGPFNLITFEDIQHRGNLIEQVINDRSMPPWKAGPADVKYLHDRRLTADEIKTLTTWIHAGMPRGDENKVLSVPTQEVGWKFGIPDVVIEMEQAFEVPADGPDIYRNFAIELPAHLQDKQLWVRGLDFQPSNPAVVHHTLFFSAPRDLLEGKRSDDGKPGMAGGIGTLFAQQGLRIPNVVQGSFKNMGGWAAGAELSLLPDGLAYSIPPKSSFILATHFHPSGKVEAEKSKIGLYLTPTPPIHTFFPIQLPPLFGFFKGIDIPAGKQDYLIEDSWTLPCDMVAFGVNSHAHYVGRTMHLAAQLPDGKELVLLNIEDWDFAWQEQYRFTEPLHLPAGTRLHAQIRYDNSAANPRNPYSPPRRITFGEESTDEMGSISLMAYPKDEANFTSLMEQYRKHVRDQISLKPLFSTRFRFLGQ